MALGDGQVPNRRLIVAGHPGHELRLWGCLQAWRPGVCVLTDGSGSTGQPRLEHTRALLAAVGATPQAPFGELTDAAIYEALRSHRHDVLLGTADRLLRTLVDDEVELVACDALEGYNPTHDVCWLLTAAAAAAARRLGHPVQAFEYAVVGRGPGSSGAGTLEHTLDAARLERKVAAARTYARAAGPVLEREVEEMLRAAGVDAFAREVLVPIVDVPLTLRFADAAPYYEGHGAQRVRDGKYPEALRLREHVLPFERALAAWRAGA